MEFCEKETLYHFNCLTASIAMSVKTKESRRMISPYQEFRMRWTLFILLPFLFYILTAYFLTDYKDITSEENE